MNDIKIGIVIPCFNEVGNLPKLIAECESIAKEGSFKFVLVNNGSKDKSENILEELNSANITTLNLMENAGYGGGILAGLKILNTDYIGWIHADMQTDLRESLLGLKNENFDFFKGIRLGRTLSERFFSAGMGLICSVIFRTSLIEINAQPTVMSRNLYNSWVNPPTDFSLDLYALVIAKRKSAKIVRSKFEFVKRTSGHSAWNFGFRSRMRMISRTLRFAIALSRNGVR